MAIFAGGSAYLWIASAAGKHPTDVYVWGGLGWVLALVIIYALAVALMIGAGWAKNDD